jgi:hypothetical protein
MNNDQLSALKQEILQDPMNLGYAALLPDSPGIVVEKLNTESLDYGKKLVPTYIGIGTILDTLGPESGAIALDNVEALKTQSSVVKWAWYLLEQARLDVSLTSTRTQLDLLVQAGAMTQTQVDLLKELAETPTSRSMVVCGETATEADVMAAMETV